ncbi:SAF domain-containing protein [Salipaludibacillus sp. HK11]|uniref:SAF domain-containing protein n=1 Tax=Salipaludibacillus sp. HK11 TaxID=3394320 RepID=UPI0039FD5CEB
MIDAKRKAMIFLIVAFILAIITSVLVLDQIRAAQDSLGERTEVAVAASNIQTYSEITEDMIDWVEIPQVENLGSFVRDMSELEGAISIVNLQDGDLLTSNILRTATEIPENHRIVWLNATSNVVLDQPVAAGDTIDIIVTYTPEDSALTTTRLFKQVDVIQREEIGEELSNIKISLPIIEAEKFIHFQNTADSIRILLSNQVQQPGQEENTVEEELPDREVIGESEGVEDLEDNDREPEGEESNEEGDSNELGEDVNEDNDEDEDE